MSPPFGGHLHFCHTHRRYGEGRWEWLRAIDQRVYKLFFHKQNPQGFPPRVHIPTHCVGTLEWASTKGQYLSIKSPINIRSPGVRK